MNQQEYQAAIKKQQSLIRKLFANRKRRNEVIQEIVDERWKHLVGKFVCLHSGSEEFNCISGFKSVADADTDKVEIIVQLKFMLPSKQDGKIVGVTVYEDEMPQHFTPDDDIEQRLADRLVSYDRVIKQFNMIGAEIARAFGL